MYYSYFCFRVKQTNRKPMEAEMGILLENVSLKGNSSIKTEN